MAEKTIGTSRVSPVRTAAPIGRRRDRRRGLRPRVEPIERRLLLSASPPPGASASPAEHRAYVTNLIASVGDATLPESAVSGWVGLLDRGVAPTSVARQVFWNPTIQGELAEGLYEDLLGRPPSASEARAAVAALRASGSFRGTIVRIAAGEEYFLRNGGTWAGLEVALERDLDGQGTQATADGPGQAALIAGRASGAASQAVRTRMAKRAMTRPDYGDPTLAQQYHGLTGTALQGEVLTRLSARINAGEGLLGILARVAGSSEVVARLAAEHAEGLAAKRVPGFLRVADPASEPSPYSSIAFAAVPFQVINIDGRAIGAGNADFWTINLNPSDTLSVQAIDPKSQQPDDGITITIWQAGGTIADAEGIPAAGTTYTLLSQTTGSAFAAASVTASDVSASNPAGVPESPGTGGVSLLIAFSPTGQPVPDPASAASPQVQADGKSAITYDALFRTYPGAQTSMIDMLSDYEDPRYSYASPDPALDQIDQWPTFTPGEAGAYDVFVRAATQGSIAFADSQGTAPGTSTLADFTDFREVGSQNDPDTQAGYLAAVWGPIQRVIQDLSTGIPPRVAKGESIGKIPSVVVDGTDYVYGFTPSEFIDAVVDPIRRGASGGGSASATDFQRVQTLIADANAARARLQSFIDDYQSWIGQQEGLLSGIAEGVASTLSKGISDSSGTVPPMTAGANAQSEVENGLGLASSGLAIASTLTQAASPITSTVTGLVSGLISFATDIAGFFMGDQEAQEEAQKIAQAEEKVFHTINTTTVTSLDILTAGQQLDEANEQTFLNSYLSMEVIETAMYSNYGLLQAFASTTFPTSDNGDLTTSQADTIEHQVDVAEKALQDDFTLAAYLSLTPQFFEWTNVTDQETYTTLGMTLSNLIPLDASYTVTHSNQATTSSYSYTLDQGLWYGVSLPSGSDDSSQENPSQVNSYQDDLETAILTLLQDFQGGVTVQPLGAGSPNWVQQGTSLQGGHASKDDWVAPIPFAGSTLAITPNTDQGQWLGRFFAAVPASYWAGIFGGGGLFPDSYSVTGSGYYIMEWGLVNPTTGQSLSSTAADTLFGLPDLSGASLVLQGGQGYLGYTPPSKALANVADVFYGRNGWAIPGGGDASAGYTPTENGGGATVGDQDHLNLAPTTQTFESYLYTIDPQPGSPSFLPTQPLPPGPATSSIVAPQVGAITIPVGTSITSPSGRYYLINQADGNLVLYDSRAANQVLWASGTSDTFAQLVFDAGGELAFVDSGKNIWSTGAVAPPVAGVNPTLLVSDDGAANIVLQGPGIANPAILWTTQPASQGSAQGDAPQVNWIGLAPGNNLGSTLQPGQVMSSGQYLLSAGGQYALVMQSNSQLVLYDLWARNITPLWSASYSYDEPMFPPQRAVMGTDGIFSISTGDETVFAVGDGVPGSIFSVLPDGNIAIFAPDGQAVWASGTPQDD